MCIFGLRLLLEDDLVIQIHQAYSSMISLMMILPMETSRSNEQTEEKGGGLLSIDYRLGDRVASFFRLHCRFAKKSRAVFE